MSVLSIRVNCSIACDVPCGTSFHSIACDVPRGTSFHSIARDVPRGTSFSSISGDFPCGTSIHSLVMVEAKVWGVPRGTYHSLGHIGLFVRLSGHRNAERRSG